MNFVIQSAASLSHIQNNETQQILMSYYLLRCKKFGLAQSYISQNTRCPHCLLEWKKEAVTKLNPIKLNKRQRQRIRNKRKKKKLINKEYLLHSNEVERICTFCGHRVKTLVQKPSKTLNPIYITKQMKEEINSIETSKLVEKLNKKGNKQYDIDKYHTNVYCKSNIAFSLCKESNTLTSLIKEPPKIIKNNKKKKDKFAGLCCTAVITASKLKQERDTNNKLNLFLKPST